VKTRDTDKGKAALRKPPGRGGLHTGPAAAFTLIELLTVIAIIGIIAAITLPNLKSFKPNVMAGASSQLLADVARARQLAISQRTTVYMVFVPTNFWGTLPPAETQNARTLLDKQAAGYNFVALRRLGSQPGERDPIYLSEWRTLPQGVIIAPEKFTPRNFAPTRSVTNNAGERLWFQGFERTLQNGVQIPFPTVNSATNYYQNLPYIAFNHLGQLVSGQDEVIPLALGSAGFRRDTTRQVTFDPVTPIENPPNNAVDSYNIVRIDWLTGRARLERQEIQ